jgi:hypothetical protein
VKVATLSEDMGPQVDIGLGVVLEVSEYFLPTVVRLFPKPETHLQCYLSPFPRTRRTEDSVLEQGISNYTIVVQVLCREASARRRLQQVCPY